MSTTKKDEGLPAVFRVPASKASLKQNRFQFQLPGERKVRSFPKFQYLKPNIAFRIEALEPMEAMQLLMETYEPDVLEKFDDLEQFESLVEAWMAASDIQMGESKPS